MSVELTENQIANAASPQTGVGQQTTWAELVQQRLGTLRYGVIQIVVHDGRVTQVECTEKVRFDTARPKETALPTLSRPESNGTTQASAARRRVTSTRAIEQLT